MRILLLYDMPTHMDVAGSGPTLVHVIELFLQPLLCARKGVPANTFGEGGRGRGEEGRDKGRGGGGRRGGEGGGGGRGRRGGEGEGGGLSGCLSDMQPWLVT